MTMLEPEPFPREGRLAAVDYGTVRIGVAICDPDWVLASPLEVHNSGTEDENAKFFRRIVQEERIAGFVVGLPIHCDGGESQKSLECREFARWLADQTSRPVRLFDERFTTAAAKQRMSKANYTSKRSKKRLDAVAALVMLEAFMEATRYHGELAGQSIDQPADGGDGLDS